MGTETQTKSASPPASADLISPATDSTPACQSASSIAQPLLPKTLTEGSAGGCTACGRDVEPLHRLKQDESVRNFCSSCILLLYKGMYCCLCFVVCEDSVELHDPARWLTCVKCQRMSHLACARDQDLPTDSLIFACHDCTKPEKAFLKEASASMGGLTENGRPPLKKLRSSSDQQISPEDEAVAAAHIAAFLAVRQAKDAKARAKALAGVAAGAAAHAKAALDTAYMVALEEARWKPESSKRFPGLLPGKNRGLPSLSVINAPRISRAGGRVSMPNLPHSHSHVLSGKVPTSSNARCSAPYSKVKVFPPSAEVMKSSPSSQHAFPRTAPLQKPHIVEHSPWIDLEGATVSASPASILDASGSLDTLVVVNLSMESDSAHVHMPESTHKTASSSMVPTRGDSSNGNCQLPVSNDEPASIDKGAEELNISAS